MPTYLSMDGVDDYILTPSISFTRIELDVKFTGHNNTRNNGVIDTRKDITDPFIFVNALGNFIRNGYSILINDANATDGTPAPFRNRVLLKATLTGTARINIFSDNNNARPIRGEIYDIKIYNGATLVAHYDMSTGTMRDQTGNGNHAMLVGGTWVSDEPAPVVYTASVSDDVTVLDTFQRSIKKQIVVTETASLVDSAAKSSRRSLTLLDNVEINDNINKSLSKMLAETLVLTDNVERVLNKSIVISDNYSVLDDIANSRQLHVMLVDDAALSDALINTSDVIISNVNLIGDVETTVYLVGARVIDVFLRGDIN